MPRGGPRPGAGRPAGAPNVRTREVAQRAAAEGISPVEAMLAIMRDALGRGDEATALDAASRAAPYCHPRLAAVMVRDDARERERRLAALSNPALDAFIRAELRRLAGPPTVENEAPNDRPDTPTGQGEQPATRSIEAKE